MKLSLERQERGEVQVIPIILRPVGWEVKPLSKLQALPRDARPVTSWHDQDEAFYDVVSSIRKVVKELATRPLIALSIKSAETLISEPAKPAPAIKPEDFTLIYRLKGLSQDIREVAFDPDGQTIATSGGSGSKILVWNTQTWRLLHFLGYSNLIEKAFAYMVGDGVYSIKISFDGQLLAYSEHSRIQLLNPKTGQHLYTLTGHSKDVHCVAFSPDGQILASSSEGKTIDICGQMSLYGNHA